MANERDIVRLITLEMRASGIAPTARAIRAIREELAGLERQIPGLADNNEQVARAIHDVVGSYREVGRASDQAHRQQVMAARKAQAAVQKLGNVVKTFAKSMLAMFGVSTGGIAAAIIASTSVLTRFNKEMLDGTSKATRFGVSFSQVAKMVDSLGRQMNLTRGETLKLFQTYEAGFRVMSTSGFEKIIGNIKKVTGPNADAMNAMLQQISGVVDKLPELQSAFERLSDVDKARIRQNVQLMAINNRISQAELKAVQRYLAGAQQMSMADKKHLEDTMEQQATMKKFAQAAERVQLSLAKAFLPLVEKLADFINNNSDKLVALFEKMGTYISKFVDYAGPALDSISENFEKWAIGIGAAYAALTAFSALVGTLVGLAPLKIMANIAGVGGRAAGAAGGAEAAVGAAGAAGGAGGVGRMAAMGGRLAKGLKLGGLGVAAFVAETGLGNLSEDLYSKGNVRGGAGAKLGAAGAGIGGAALTGAAIGSIIPGIGTGIGAGVGAFIGAVANFGNIVGGFQDLWTGKTKDEREIEAKRKATVELFANSSLDFSNGLTSTISQVMAGAGGGGGYYAEKEEALAKERKDVSEAAIKDVTEKTLFGVAPVDMATLGKERKAAEDKIAAIRKDMESKRAGKDYRQMYDVLDPKTGETIQEQVKVGLTDEGIASAQAEQARYAEGAAELEKKIAAAKAAGNNEEAAQLALTKQAYETRAATIGESVKKVEEIRGKEELTNDVLQDELTNHTKISAQYNAQELVAGRLKDLAEARGQETQAQLGVLDSMVQKATQLGNISPQDVAGQVKNYVEAIDAQAAALSKVKESLENVDTTDVEAARAEKIKIITESTGAYATDEAKAKALEEVKAQTAEEIINKAEIGNITKQLTDLEIARGTAGKKVLDAYEGQIGVLASQASVYTSLVNLADNFAIGVGASVAMRKQAADALQEQIDLERERVAEARKLMEMNPGNLEYQRAYYEGENRILGLQQQQAGLLKSTRDGWIRAIGAMNTGAGRFTKIMISQEQNMESGLRNINGMLTSFTSGSIGPGGYKGSTKFAGMGGGVVGEGFAGLGGSAGVSAREPYAVSVESPMLNMAMDMKGQLTNAMQQQANRAQAGGGPVFMTDMQKGMMWEEQGKRGPGARKYSAPNPRSYTPGISVGMGYTPSGGGRPGGAGRDGQGNIFANFNVTVKYGEWNKLANEFRKAVSHLDNDVSSYINAQGGGPKVRPGE